MPETIAFITVRTEERQGRYFAYSDDLPGLYICGDNLQDVLADVAPMIQDLYKVSRDLEVTVKAAADPLSFEVPSGTTIGGSFRFWATPSRELMAA